VYGILDLNVYHYYAHVLVVVIDVPPKSEFLPPIGARQHRIIFDIDDGSTKETKPQVQRPSPPSQQRNSFLRNLSAFLHLQIVGEPYSKMLSVCR
jgi:hypothetical protein